MNKKVEWVLSPQEAFDRDSFRKVVEERLRLGPAGEEQFRLVRRSIDARSRKVSVHVVGEVIPAGAEVISYKRDYPDVSESNRAIIVGAGPAGLFAALKLIEEGIKPVVLERGKDVQARRRDIAAINKDQIVNPDSNYCYGEGGAGTYSDGKLYTRSTKRGDIRRILEIFVAHGASEEILIDAHPHIGTNKLPKIIQQMRESIVGAGGEVHFESRVTDLLIEGGSIEGVVVNETVRVDGKVVLLATGHSARDIFELLVNKGVKVEAKPFALGVRVEHPQQLIDNMQYHCGLERGPWLPAAPYSLVHQVPLGKASRGVFSFCMCPGGFIVPAATAPGEVVVNGMSPSRRDSKYANSGIVVSVEVSDFANPSHPLSGVEFQRAIEQKACQMAGGRQMAPAQLLVDFVQGKVSATLNPSSYQPGLVAADVNALFPGFISAALREGFKAFGQKMKGYLTNEAQVVGTESRTSSPVRIPRDPVTLNHTEIEGLFPCGEGAGYAGGIVSAAMDGERSAAAIVNHVRKR